MLGYDVGVLALLPLLERLDYREGGPLTLQLKDLRMGEFHFLSGQIRLQASRPTTQSAENGKHG